MKTLFVAETGRNGVWGEAVAGQDLDLAVRGWLKP